MQKLTGKSVLVTGGAGFIGSHLVDRITVEKPGNLIVVDNLFLGKESNLEDQTGRCGSQPRRNGNGSLWTSESAGWVWC